MNKILIIVGALIFALGLIMVVYGKSCNESFENKLEKNVLPALKVITPEQRNQMIDDNNDIIHKDIEFRFVNLSPKNLKIFYEGGPGPLIYITTIPAGKDVYVYNINNILKPGTMLFSKFEEDGEGEFAFKPYPLYYMDYNIYFGEISIDFLRSEQTYSDRNEILSIKFINRGLRPYNVWYRGDYIGKVEGYEPSKFDVDYSITSTNDEKHFQLGTWLDFILDAPGATKQSIQLLDKNTNIVYLGDVVGRTELNG